MAELSTEECESLIKRLSDEYGLDGMILDLSNGWVLRDSWASGGRFVASGKDRVPAALCQRALEKQQHVTIK